MPTVYLDSLFICYIALMPTTCLDWGWGVLCPFDSWSWFVLRRVTGTGLYHENGAILRYKKCKAIIMWILSLFYPQVLTNYYFDMLNFFLYMSMFLCKSLACWSSCWSHSLLKSLLLSIKRRGGIRWSLLSVPLSLCFYGPEERTSEGKDIKSSRERTGSGQGSGAFPGVLWK